ncbi:MAG: hypothetical protein KDA83_04485 [Planctomycetales bacterium]|nr:hypothetical protein [Planctomycetales bacterium]
MPSDDKDVLEDDDAWDEVDPQWEGSIAAEIGGALAWPIAYQLLITMSIFSVLAGFFLGGLHLSAAREGMGDLRGNEVFFLWGYWQVMLPHLAPPALLCMGGLLVLITRLPTNIEWSVGYQLSASLGILLLAIAGILLRYNAGNEAYIKDQVRAVIRAADLDPDPRPGPPLGN